MSERLPITCCCIVKNEEEFLKASLDSVAPFVEELIILDTGSSDRTPAIAQSFQSQVPQFVLNTYQWNDDFSAARNYVASLATKPWVFFIDGDEVLDETAFDLIRQAIQHSSISCYSLVQRNYTASADVENSKPVTEKNLPGLTETPSQLFYFENWMERLYQPNHGLVYEGRVHESLLLSADRLKLKTARLHVVLHHYGRLKKNLSQKIEYYLKLSEKKWKEEPQKPVSWIEYAVTLMEIGQPAAAYSVMSEAVKKFQTEPEILKTAFQAALRADRFSEAEQWISLYLKDHSEDAFARAQLTTALLYQRKFSDVLNLAQMIFQKNPEDFVAHVNCGVVYFEQGDYENAMRHIDSALKQKPNDSFLISARKKISAVLQKR